MFQIPATKIINAIRRMGLITTLVMIVGLGLTLFFFFWLRAVEFRQLQDGLNITSRDRMQGVIDRMEQCKSKLFNFTNAFYYAHSDNILKGNFEGFSQTANLFLTSHPDIKKIMLPDKTILLVAVPNFLVYKNRLKMFLGKFNYEETGLLDKTHVRWYTFKSLKKLFHYQKKN